MTSDFVPSSLIQGQSYFMLSYFDRALRLPNIFTCVYVGKNLFDEDASAEKTSYYFQSAESFVRKGLFRASASQSLEGITVVPSDSLHMIYDWDGLARELSENKRMQDRGEAFD